MNCAPSESDVRAYSNEHFAPAERTFIENAVAISAELQPPRWMSSSNRLPFTWETSYDSPLSPARTIWYLDRTKGSYEFDIKGCTKSNLRSKEIENPNHAFHNS
jgi:hypothetical protein